MRNLTLEQLKERFPLEPLTCQTDLDAAENLLDSLKAIDEEYGLSPDQYTYKSQLQELVHKYQDHLIRMRLSD